MTMFESLHKNIRTFKNALGKEPLGQIFANAWRKLIGEEPVVQEAMSYPVYCKAKRKSLKNKYKGRVPNTEIDLIWYVQSGEMSALQRTLASIEALYQTPRSISLVSANP